MQQCSKGYVMPVSSRYPVEKVSLHGHERAFIRVGSGPVLLLVHGIGSRHETWAPIVDELARHFTVIAPDLLGHGQSAKPRADYSIGGYANGLRDLLTVLEIDRVTVLGHSLGGGIAMQFAYQFPHRTERIVLVGTGGLGPEVNPLIPLCTLPGASTVVGVVASPVVQPAGQVLLKGLARTKLPFTADLDELATVYADLQTREARQAFRHVLRAIVDTRGQIVTMRDRAYLTRHIPTMVIWGRNDTVIPVGHADVASQVLDHARIVVLPHAGHFPHSDQPNEFIAELLDFVTTTEPAVFDEHKWNLRLRRDSDWSQSNQIASVSEIRAKTS